MRDSYRGANLYTWLVFDEDGVPDAIQANISSEALNLDQHTLSNIDAIAMMTTLALREYPADYVAARLFECARGPSTLASIFGNVILDHGMDK